MHALPLFFEQVCLGEMLAALAFMGQPEKQKGPVSVYAEAAGCES